MVKLHSREPLWASLLSFATLVLADGCDQSEPECCYQAWSSWSSSKRAFETGSPSLYSTALRAYSTEIPNPSLTTLCDGFPGSWAPTTRPLRRISDEDCTPFILDYESSSAEYQTNASAPWPSVHPPCTTYSACPGEGEGMCKMIADVATIYYWPATVTGDSCGDRTTLTHDDPTRTTELHGTTFTSPSVYVVVDSLQVASYAGKYKAKGCGHDLYNRVIAMHPTDVSTHFGPLKKNNQVFRQLDLADLNRPVPATAYFGVDPLPDCAADPDVCATSTISLETEVYRWLSAPTQLLRDLDATELAACDLHPSQRTALGAEWVALEPTQDGWPEITGVSSSEGAAETSVSGETMSRRRFIEEDALPIPTALGELLN
ncbi:unnamed protein product [Parascedosporium putredinis]|uniref:Uncharacterized protein n=1 Tax=Parascedosporium putredinis TaxID=1442378 RepID=A0A9P1GYJ5_9PEZI|nr:unnamed protein product [Parascedosporium putredinis]CAI7991828.1 unnamed protein product [Parascedosporium putredinis]